MDSGLIDNTTVLSLYVFFEKKRNQKVSVVVIVLHRSRKRKYVKQISKYEQIILGGKLPTMSGTCFSAF